MNTVKFFEDYTLYELQERIEKYCKKYNKEPLSVSICIDNAFIAAVVLKERE